MARIYYSMYNVFSLLFIFNRKVFINFIDLKKLNEFGNQISNTFILFFTFYCIHY